MRGKSFTIPEILRAISLRQNHPWSTVASILDRPIDSLKTIICRYHHGWRPKFSPEKTEQMIQECIGGKTMTQIAKDYGVCKAAISGRFKRAGFDAEVRAEYGLK